MAKTYTCPHAEIEWEGIICKKDGQPCGHIRWCMEKGRVILTEQALTCTRRKELETLIYPTGPLVDKIVDKIFGGDGNDESEAHKDNSDKFPNES